MHARPSIARAPREPDPGLLDIPDLDDGEVEEWRSVILPSGFDRRRQGGGDDE